MSAPYLANTYPVAKGKLPGTERWVELAAKHSNGALWNNGTWIVRDINGQPGVTSNHARGVAMDLSYRFMPANNRGVSGGRQLAVRFLRTVVANWEPLGLQLAIDYWPQPFGRSWRCDRTARTLTENSAEAWRRAVRPTFRGAPGGDWLHLEITLELATNPEKVAAAFRKVFATV